MAGQTFHPTTSTYLRKVDKKNSMAQNVSEVTPERPYNVDGSITNPYTGDWKSTLAPDLDWNFKMRNGSLEIYATTGILINQFKSFFGCILCGINI